MQKTQYMTQKIKATRLKKFLKLLTWVSQNVVQNVFFIYCCHRLANVFTLKEESLLKTTDKFDITQIITKGYMKQICCNYITACVNEIRQKLGSCFLKPEVAILKLFKVILLILIDSIKQSYFDRIDSI